MNTNTTINASESTESKLIVDSTPAPTPTTGMTSIELLAKNLVKSVKAGNVSNHIKDNDTESWIISNVEDDNKGGEYKMEIVQGLNKSGKKYCKHTVYRVSTGKPVNFGIYKKKVLYTLAYNLESGKVFKKIKQDPASVKAIAKDMKTNADNWKQDGNTIIGTMGNDKINITREAHLIKNGKTMYKITATKNNEEFLSGSQLMILFK